MSAETVTVELGSRSYPVRIGAGMRREALAAAERRLASGQKCVAITSPGVAAAQSGFPAPSELCAMSAVELARRLRRKDVSAREVLEAHLARIEQVNPKVNALIHVMADEARAGADAADTALAQGGPIGPLHGR